MILSSINKILALSFFIVCLSNPIFSLDIAPDSSLTHKLKKFIQNRLSSLRLAWHNKEFDKQEYDNWVQDKYAYWTENNISNLERVTDLLYYAQNIQELQTRLYAYNLLRSLKRLPLAYSEKDIDQEWLKEQACQYDDLYNDWVKSKTTNWENNKKGNSEEILLYQAQDAEDRMERLYAYNFLRSRAALSLAHLVEDIDQEWLNEQNYHRWKMKEQLDFKKLSKNTTISQIAFLAGYIDYTLKDTALDWCGDKYYSRILLHNYNFLRELLHKDTIKNIAQIDKQWVDQVFKKSNALEIMEENDYNKATFAQKQLVKQAQEIVGLEKDLETFQHWAVTGGASGSNFIAVCKIPDLDYTVGVIYHELGHIKHRDYMLSEGLNEVQGRLDDPDMQEDISQITGHLSKGERVIDSSSELGKHLLKLMHDHLAQKDHVYWTPPTDHEKYLRSLFDMNKERRADLFMLTTLYKLNKTNAIISKLYYYGMFVNILKIGAATHPSPTERALYMIGFLANKGIDVNAELRKWESEGTCISREHIFTRVEEPVLTEGARDVQRMC